MIETDHSLNEEEAYLAEAEEVRPPEREDAEEWQEAAGDAPRAEAEPAAADPGLRAVMEHKGGEADDWSLEQRGESGYRFDGEHVRGPDGAIWMNEDAGLHREMLAQWQEGRGAVFFLPDYRETTADGETLYVTQLILAENGAVTYEIHKHEIEYQRDETETASPEEPAERAATSEMYREVFIETEEGREAGPAADTVSVSETAKTERGGERETETAPVADAWLLQLLRDDLPATERAAQPSERMPMQKEQRASSEPRIEPRPLRERTKEPAARAARDPRALTPKDEEQHAGTTDAPAYLIDAQALAHRLGIPLPTHDGGRAAASANAQRASRDGVIMEFTARERQSYASR